MTDGRDIDGTAGIEVSTRGFGVLAVVCWAVGVLSMIEPTVGLRLRSMGKRKTKEQLNRDEMLFCHIVGEYKPVVAIFRASASKFFGTFGGSSAGE